MCSILKYRNHGKKEKKLHELLHKGSEAVGELAHECLMLNQALEHNIINNKLN